MLNVPIIEFNMNGKDNLLFNLRFLKALGKMYCTRYLKTYKRFIQFKTNLWRIFYFILLFTDNAIV